MALPAIAARAAAIKMVDESFMFDESCWGLWFVIQRPAPNVTTTLIQNCKGIAR